MPLTEHDAHVRVFRRRRARAAYMSAWNRQRYADPMAPWYEQRKVRNRETRRRLRLRGSRRSEYEANRRRSAEGAAIINARKDAPCMDCGGSFPPCAMDFDHVRGVKKFDIGAGRGVSRVRLHDELAKCELVCANCHRVRTHARRTAARSRDGE